MYSTELSARLGRIEFGDYTNLNVNIEGPREAQNKVFCGENRTGGLMIGRSNAKKIRGGECASLLHLFQLPRHFVQDVRVITE